jgi:hypothetical protein
VKKFLIIISIVLAFTFIKIYADEGEQHNNHIEVSVGETYGFYHDGKAHLTVGADYSHNFFATKPNLGLGLLVEAVTGTETEIIIGIPFSVFVTGKLKVFVAPSYIIIPLKSASIKSPLDTMNFEETPNVSEETNTFFLRTGISFDMQFGRFSLTPSVSADVIYSKLNMFFGLGVGISF